MTELANRRESGLTWRDAYAGGELLPSQEAVLNLANDVFGTLEGDIAGQPLTDVLSVHEDAYENTFAIGVDVPFADPPVVVLGAPIPLHDIWDRAISRDELVTVSAAFCAAIDRLVPFALAGVMASDAPAPDANGANVGRPVLDVMVASYQGSPALVFHGDDERMTEWLWFDLFRRIAEDAQNPGAEQLWAGSRRDGLQLADLSSDTGFRAAMQYPAALSPDEALARMSAFAPEFDWVVQAEDTSESIALPTTGAIKVAWKTVSDDIDPVFRYEWSVDAGQLEDPELVSGALSIAASTVDEW